MTPGLGLGLGPGLVLGLTNSCLLTGKKYTVLNVVAMLFMCVGLVLFNLADVSVSPNMDHTGLSVCLSVRH